MEIEYNNLDELLDSKEFNDFMDSCNFEDGNNDDKNDYYETLEDTGRYPS